MIKTKDIKIVTDCAREYEKNLLDKDVLIVYKEKLSGKYKYIEQPFRAGNFQHLTGIIYAHRDDVEQSKEYVPELDTDSKSAVDFFGMALKNRLNAALFNYKEDGSARLKLDVLPIIVNLPWRATMVGPYNGYRVNIRADFSVGSIVATLLSRKDENNILRPVSALQEDLKKTTTSWSPIKAVYLKNKDDSLYNTKCKCTKNFNTNCFPDNIKALILPDVL